MKPTWWPFEGLAFGGDWNPDQWPDHVVARDLELMQFLGVNLVSLPVFGWAQLEPRRGEFTLDWLGDVLDTVAAAGIRVCLATATATPPAWLVREDPSVLPVDRYGHRFEYGSRQSYCPSSVSLSSAVETLVSTLARRFGRHPALAMWHVNNEYGDHVVACYCSACAARFRLWLMARYGNLDGINEAWGTRVWGQYYTSIDHIEPPRLTTAESNPAQVVDFDRFSSDNVRSLFELEVKQLRTLTPDVPLTTNFMSILRGLDYWSFAPLEDIVSDDAYPDPANPHSHHDIALTYGLMRSLKARPWLLLESAPSAASWREVNVPKAPGQHRVHLLQAVAHGADGVSCFQWRAARAGTERFHSAIVGHRGERSRTFTEAQRYAADVHALRAVVGTRVRSSVAMAVDWNSIRAMNPQASLPSARLDWYGQTYAYHQALHALGFAVDAFTLETEANHDAPDDHDPLGRYSVLVLPCQPVVTSASAARLSSFVRNGGRVIVGPFSGVMDPDQRVHLGGAPGPLSDLLGVEVDEPWPLTRSDRLEVVMPSGAAGRPRIWAEWLQPDPATDTLATFAGGALDGRPAVTRHRVGRGAAYYVGCDLAIDALHELVSAVCAEAGLDFRAESCPSVEVTIRTDGHDDYTFVINHGPHPARVRPLAAFDLLLPDDPQVEVGQDVLTVPGFGVVVLRMTATEPAPRHVHRVEVLP